jgi:kumamolisin
VPERIVFHDSIVPIPVAAGLTPNGMIVQEAAASHGDERMTVHFSLTLPGAAQADLEAKVARGEVVPPDVLQRDYAAANADADALIAWLKSEGFDVADGDVSPDRTSIYATARVSQIEKSLDVNMVRVTVGGLTYTAARNAPSLPTEVGASVQAIGGLQPFRRVHKHGKRRPAHQGNRGALGSQTPAPAPNIANRPPYLAREILRAYNGDTLRLTGRGQTIAILIDTFPADADLQAFWARNQLPVTLAQIEKVNVNGGTLPPPEGEETLDVQWSSGIAPGATIRIYATGSLQFVDLDRALDRILADVGTQPGMRQLSISLGLGETYLGGPGGEVATEHQKFLKLAAAGVNVFVSTGDAGSNPDETGQSATGPTQVEYESSDPCVIGVGGTTLTLAADGAVANETGWANGGGGRSMYFARPDWQKGPGISGSRRLVPDVSMTADPDQGGFVVLHGAVQQFGGTSWSAPIWAGICALVNEARAQNRKPPLGFLNPLLYPRRAECFRDIDSGSNGAYHAVAGYDLVTGLGVPDIARLVQELG